LTHRDDRTQNRQQPSSPDLPASFVDNLQYSSGSLALDGEPLAALADRFVSPLFVGSRRRIEHNVARFMRAFSSYPAPVVLSY